MKYALLAVKNYLDFFLRNLIKISRKVTDETPPPQRDKKLQLEFREFIFRFDWRTILKSMDHSPLIVTDIGARNFVFGPVIDDVFKKYQREAVVHGIEIDAHRLLWGFHSRADFGEYYARKMREGFYHAIDFLKWNQPTDIAFLLNPFVSKEPLLSWGLPLSKLRPQEVFNHTMKTLKAKAGILILSCPSPEELEIARGLAAEAGFIEGPQVFWSPPKKSVQQKPRYGIVYYSALCS